MADMRAPTSATTMARSAFWMTRRSTVAACTLLFAISSRSMGASMAAGAMVGIGRAYGGSAPPPQAARTTAAMMLMKIRRFM
jgi:hypothetical protein